MPGFAAISRASLPSVLLLLGACGGSGAGGPPASQTVGGSISGLASAGLVLANGSDTVSPASGATAFTFAVAVASGASYAVVVKTQPAGATCTVTGGTGTVAATAVTSVAVACTPATFQIGGTISGLSAAGLVLANGSDSTSPAANATSFAFAKRVTAGAGYSVSVTQQPTGSTCTVANGSGTATADVSNVAVSCTALPVAHWSAPITVGSGLRAQLANDPSGVAFFLAWCSCTGAGGVTDAAAPTVASRFTDAGGWGPPATMAMTDGGILAGIQFDAQGKGFALWAAPSASDGSTFPMFSRYTPGVGWGFGAMPFSVQLPPVTAPPGSLLFSSLPALGLSVGLDGSAVAMVEENVSVSTNGVVTLENLAALEGGAVAGSDVLEIGSADPSFPASDSSPTTFVDGNGHTVLYFAQQTLFPFDPVTASTLSGHFATLYRTFDRIPATLPDGSQGLDTLTVTGLDMHAGGVGSTITLFTEDLLAENPLARGVNRIGVSKASTAIAANGDALVTWSVIADDLASISVLAARFIGGSWFATHVIYTNAGDYSEFRQLPVAALDGAGNGLIVFDAPGALTAVKLDAASGAFSAAVPLAAVTEVPVSLQMDVHGNAFLLTAASVRRYDAASATWSTPVAAGGNSVDAPTLALDTEGNAMVAWSSGGSVLAMRYH
jgi:hypothetical protein